MVHINQRDTGINYYRLIKILINKKRVDSALFLYILFFIIGCEFKSPQKWESPSWYLPLTVPIIDQIYSFSGIQQDSTIVQDTLNNSLDITFSDNIVEPGGDRPGIDDSIFDFKIPASPNPNIFNEPFDPPSAPSDPLPSESIEPVTISLSDILPSASSGCLPDASIGSDANVDGSISNSIPILSEFSSISDQIQVNNQPVIQKIHLITVNSGTMGVTVTNTLSFELTSFQLTYKSLENENYRELFSTNVEPDKFSLPILPNTIAQKQIIINSDNKVQFGDSLIIELAYTIDFPQSGPDDCGLLGNGWQLDDPISDYALSIQFDFQINANSAENIICTTNEIAIETTENITFTSPSENIEIKGGKVTNEFEQDLLNSIKLVVSNSLFTSTDINIKLPNFFNADNIPMQIGGEIIGDQVFVESLSEYFLGRPGEPDSILKSIDIGIEVVINSIENSPIALGQSYALSISAFNLSEINLAYLTAITYDLSFDTPSSNIDAVPQGGIGLQFYDVQLILDIYTQIGIPIQLDMLLKGKKGVDSVMAVIDPELNVPGINTTNDSVRTIITLNRDGQKVEWYNMGNNGESPDSVILYPPEPNEKTIVDVMNFAPEKIEFGGGAKINGEGFLAPNSFLWGNFKLIAKMAFVFEEPINIIPAAATSMPPMDSATKDQIDSSLVNAELNVNMYNSSVLGGSLSMLISDSTVFPLFIDSLVTGSWIYNEQYQLDNYGYKIDTSIWDTLRSDLDIVIDSINFTAIDSTADTLKALEVQFFREDSMQFFIGRIFELGFPRSDSIEYNLGYINSEFPKITESSLSIDKTKMDWVITDELRYNVSMITFDKSPIHKIVDNDIYYIPLTFQTTNFIGVQAYLTLTLNTDGLFRQQDNNYSE